MRCVTRTSFVVAALMALTAQGGAEPRQGAFTWLLYCTPWGGCWIQPFYTETVNVVAPYGRLDVDWGGRWGTADTSGCPECEIEGTFPQFDAPAPEPVGGGGLDYCGDARDDIIVEYANSEWVNQFVPTCSMFASGGGSEHFSWAELNQSPGSGHQPWGIVDSILTGGLESTRSNFNNDAILVNSGYRCPHGNASVGGAALSRHMLGTAADIMPLDGYSPPSESLFAVLRSAAFNAGAFYLTEWDTYADRHLHADWR